MLLAADCSTKPPKSPGGRAQGSRWWKTSLDFSVQMKGETLLQWLESWLGTSLTFRETAGQIPVLHLGKMGSSNGQYWTRNSSTWRNFHLAQRRERVFIILDTGNWQDRPPLLLELESLRGNPAPRRQTRQETTYSTCPSIGASGRGFSRAGETRGQDPVIPIGIDGEEVGFALRAGARLQGFPDDYLNIIHNGKPAKDGPKYRALGNSMATPVMVWIGKQIQEAVDTGK